MVVEVPEFWKMWSLNALCQTIHSLVHIDFCCADCVKSFEKVNSVLRIVKKKKERKINNCNIVDYQSYLKCIFHTVSAPQTKLCQKTFNWILACRKRAKARESSERETEILTNLINKYLSVYSTSVLSFSSTSTLTFFHILHLAENLIYYSLKLKNKI